MPSMQSYVLCMCVCVCLSHERKHSSLFQNESVKSEDKTMTAIKKIYGLLGGTKKERGIEME